MRRNFYMADNEYDEEPSLMMKVWVFVFILLGMAIVLTVVYYFGAYNAVKDMGVSLSDFGEVTLELNGRLYPEFFSAMK